MTDESIRLVRMSPEIMDKFATRTERGERVTWAWHQLDDGTWEAWLTVETWPSVFPLDLDTFSTGLDSPWHNRESRDAWIRLFFRDMQVAAAKQGVDTAPTGT